MLSSSGALWLLNLKSWAIRFLYPAFVSLLAAIVISFLTPYAWVRESVDWVKANKLRALMFLFVGIGLLLFLLSAGLFLHDIIHEALTNTGEGMHNEERLAIMLLFPALICFFIASVLHALKVWTIAAWRHAGYQVGAFIILALSLHAFANHSVSALVNEPHVGDDNSRKAVAEMAAVMILFILAELAAFVGRDVHEATDSLHTTIAELKTMRESVTAASESATKSSNGIAESANKLGQVTYEMRDQLIMAASVTQLHPGVHGELAELISGWSQRVPAKSNGADELASYCWRTLLKQYLREELIDIRPQSLVVEGIPESVQPLNGTPEEHVSYIATNIGFYAKFLASLLKDVSQESQERANKKLCLAVVTSVLPAQWWDWPNTRDKWFRYQPIVQYRDSLKNATASGARIDRVILVERHDNHSPSEQQAGGLTGQPSMQVNEEQRAINPQCTLWSESLLNEMLDNWLLLTNPDQDSVPCGDGYREYCNLQENQDFEYPKQVLSAASEVSERRVVPIVLSTNGTETQYKSGDGWTACKLRAAYKELHGVGGKCWKLATSKGSDLLGGRHDVVFVGEMDTGQNHDRRGLWEPRRSENEKFLKWGMCLMSSMSPDSETMFLTVITGESVKRHYDWVQKTLIDERVDWDTDLLIDPTPSNVPSSNGTHPPEVQAGAGSGTTGIPV